MEIRVYAPTQGRKGESMSKSPDLSAFPIPRKGGAKPIDMDDASASAAAEGQRIEQAPEKSLPEPKAPPFTALPEARTQEAPQLIIQPLSPPRETTTVSTTSGQTVATTVKLDENRYLRLAEAGRPGPGRLKRLTIQQIMIEALDEWFERRGL